VYEETLTGRPHDTSVQKATSDNENVDTVQRHAQDKHKTIMISGAVQSIRSRCEKDFFQQYFEPRIALFLWRSAGRKFHAGSWTNGSGIEDILLSCVLL